MQSFQELWAQVLPVVNGDLVVVQLQGVVVLHTAGKQLPTSIISVKGTVRVEVGIEGMNGASGGSTAHLRAGHCNGGGTAANGGGGEVVVKRCLCIKLGFLMQ